MANATQSFLDSSQYARKSILKYERIFGHTWVSTGGESTTKEFAVKIKPKVGDKMLDIGCGTGGSACYFARYFGVTVEGVDLSANMVSIANERLIKEDADIQRKIKYIIGDIMKTEYPEDTFDIIYSRDTILHIKDKEELFGKLLVWLKPGGKLFITDYCRGDQVHRKDFTDYVAGRGYDLRTVVDYGKIIQKAGFKNVQTTDGAQMFQKIIEEELKYFIATETAFIQDFSKDDYDEIANGWMAKSERVGAGDQSWGIFFAKK